MDRLVWLAPPDLTLLQLERKENKLFFFWPIEIKTFFLQNCDFMFLATLASSVTMSSALDVELVLLSLHSFSLSVSGIENVSNLRIRKP